MKDPYAALGLTKTATDAEIKAAFRKLTRKLHPDLHPGDAKAEEAFKEISVANDLLGDPEKRRRFDAGEIDASGAEMPARQFYRDYAQQPGNGYRPGGRSGGRTDAPDMDDIFAEFLRGAGQSRAQGQMRGADARYSLQVRFLDAARGAKLPIALPEGGSLTVTLPAGCEDGQTLRLRGKGGSGYGDGPAGDALVTISVAPHPVFSRIGDDIFITLPITLDEAVLGGKVTAPTLGGAVSVTIPKGASSGQTLRLRGRGVARVGVAKGDQLIDLRIIAPPVIDEGLADFMQAWRKTHAYDPRKAMFEEDLE